MNHCSLYSKYAVGLTLQKHAAYLVSKAEE